MKHAVTIFICLMMMAGVACRKKPVAYPANELHYKETHCSDAWRPLQIADTQQAVKEWLQHQGITPSYVKVTQTPKGFVSCEACNCLSGRTIRVLFDAADIEKAKSLGFYKP